MQTVKSGAFASLLFGQVAAEDMERVFPKVQDTLAARALAHLKHRTGETSIDLSDGVFKLQIEFMAILTVQMRVTDHGHSERCHLARLRVYQVDNTQVDTGRARNQGR